MEQRRMDAFDFTEDPQEEKPRRKQGSILLTLGAYYFLAISIFLIGFFVVIYLDPYNALNPFPPPAPTEDEFSSLMPAETGTPTETAVSPTATETSTQMPTTTPEQPAPTDTTIPYPTATEVVLATSQPGDTPEVVTHYKAQDGTPAYIPHSGGCNGVYVAGNVIDIDNHPVMLMAVRATGLIGEEFIEIESLSGSNPDYSESGWEIKLSDQLVSTTGSIFIGLYPQGAFDPISDLVVIDTFNDCSKNLAIVNFVQDQ
jgi:hypothetical protein